MRRHESAADDFAFNLYIASVRISAHGEINGPTFIEREQHLRRYRVVAIVLFENLERPPAWIAQNHGVRLQMCGHTRVLRLVHAGLQIEWHMLARYEEILVVDGKSSRTVIGGLLGLWRCYI